MQKNKIRLFIDDALHQSAKIILLKQQHHYLKNVMRCNVGESLILFNGKDGEWIGKIDYIDKRNTCIIVDSQVSEQFFEKPLGLIFAPIKHVSTSFIIEKATEMGVTEIYPIFSRYSVIRKINIEKLKETAKEAAEQSERMTIPEIYEIMNIESFFLDNAKNYDNIIFLNERSNTSDMTNALMKSSNTNNNLILVGPEGGFSAQEKEFIMSFRNIVSVSLGKAILRSETAIFASIAIYQSVLGGWRI